MSRPATMFYWRDRGFATDAGGKRTVLVKGRRTKANRELALQRLAQLLKNGATPGATGSGHAVNGTLSNPTVAQVIKQFLDECEARVQAGELKASTLSLFYRPYLALIEKALGTIRARALSRTTVLGYRTRLKQGLKHNTVKNYLGVLRTLLRWARKQGVVVGDGLDAIPCLPRRRREKIPTDAELQRLLAASPPDVRDVLETLLNVAVRPGDLYHLRREWVDLEQGLLRLPDSKTGPRTVVLVPRVMEIIASRLQTEACRTTGHVFTTPAGRRWTLRYFAEKVRDVRRKAGLSAHVVAYSLRHCWTTNAFRSGLDLATVRALRNDADVRTTMHYEHLSLHMDHLQRAACRAVGAALPEDR